MQVVKEVGIETSGDKDEVWLELVETREDLGCESFSPSI
jgi:hypothetical protein